MSERSLELQQRRRELLLRSEAQRRELGHTTRELEQRLQGIDHIINVTRRFVAQPALIAGGLAAIVMIGPKRLLGWAGRAVVLFSTGRRLIKRIR
jgi:YqjK-like protein